jgi:DNA-binding NarL/FixJ family response regulator
MPNRPLTLLLVEQQPLIRSTLVAVARQIELAQIEETASIDIAEQRLRYKTYDGLLLSMDETTRALNLLQRLRDGELSGCRMLPVVAMAASCNAELVQQMKRHEVRRLLLKPFKVKELLQSIETLGEHILSSQPA